MIAALHCHASASCLTWCHAHMWVVCTRARARACAHSLRTSSRRTSTRAHTRRHGCATLASTTSATRGQGTSTLSAIGRLCRQHPLAPQRHGWQTDMAACCHTLVQHLWPRGASQRSGLPTGGALFSAAWVIPACRFWFDRSLQLVGSLSPLSGAAARWVRVRGC